MLSRPYLGTVNAHNNVTREPSLFIWDDRNCSVSLRKECWTELLHRLSVASRDGFVADKP